MNIEHEAGIRARFSHLERPHGAIKVSPSDFMVSEIPDELPRRNDGKFLILRVRLTNFDTTVFVNHLSRKLGISRKRVTFSGTKDKRAVTEQYFCLNTQNSDVPNLGDGAEILESFRTDKMLRLGDLLGNRFSIRISTEADQGEALNKSVRFLLDHGGFPNFYGPQRFGTLRPITQRVGRLILQKRMEDAVVEYLCDPEFDKEQYRMDFFNHRDAKKALKEFPMHLRHERSILGKIAETGKISEGLSGLPLELRMMFIHAYQSYIFNVMLSERILEGRDTYQVEVGDVCYSVDGYFNAEKVPVEVTNFNFQKILDLSRSDKIRATIPIAGYETRFASDREKNATLDLLESDGLSLQDFKLRDDRDLSSKGERRIISCKPLGFTVTSRNVIEFSLGKGIYATSLLREIIRENSD